MSTVIHLINTLICWLCVPFDRAAESTIAHFTRRSGPAGVCEHRRGSSASSAHQEAASV